MTIDTNIGSLFYLDSSGGLYYKWGDTLFLDVNHSIYYTKTSPKGEYYQQALYTAYFSVPELYFDDDFKLTSLSCRWKEAHTTPRVVTDDTELYKCLKQLADYDGALDGSVYDYGAILANVRCAYSKNRIIFDNSINLPKDPDDFSDNYLSKTITMPIVYNDWLSPFVSSDVFNNAFLVDDLDDFYIDCVTGSYTGYKYASNKRLSVTDNVDDGCLKGINIYEISSEDLFDVTGRFDDSCWYYGFVSLFLKDDEDFRVSQLITISDPSVIGDLSDDLIISSYYIGEHYLDDFKTACAKAAANGEQMVLLRYAVRDYYSAPALYVSPDDYALKLKNWFVSNVIVTPSNCIVMGYTYFDDFTVIDLTFSSESVSYSIDVKCEPTDVLPGGMPPSDPDSLIYDIINIGSSVGEGISDAMRVVRIVIKVVLAVVITLVAIKLITALVKLLKAIFHRRT